MDGTLLTTCIRAGEIISHSSKETVRLMVASMMGSMILHIIVMGVWVWKLELNIITNICLLESMEGIFYKFTAIICTRSLLGSTEIDLIFDL